VIKYRLLLMEYRAVFMECKKIHGMQKDIATVGFAPLAFCAVVPVRKRNLKTELFG